MWFLVKVVSVDMSKITMVDWPMPRTLRELRRFLGLTCYYRRFNEEYASISMPGPLKKDNFEWCGDATTF